MFLGQWIAGTIGFVVLLAALGSFGNMKGVSSTKRNYRPVLIIYGVMFLLICSTLFTLR